MTNSNITNAQAIAMSIELAKDANNDALVSKLTKMYEVASKPRKKSDTPTKQQIARVNMLNELLTIAPNEPFGTRFIIDNVKYCNTPQQATAILMHGIKSGKIAKSDSVKGRTQYVIVNREPYTI